jgi:hypothetical protein
MMIATFLIAQEASTGGKNEKALPWNGLAL